MASVHGIACTFVKGILPAAKQRVMTFERWGINGTGAELGGYGDNMGSFQAIFLSSLAGVASWVSSIEAKQGTIGTIIDDRGLNYTLAFIHKVGTPDVRRIYRPGSAVTYRAEIQIDAFQYI